MKYILDSTRLFRSQLKLLSLSAKKQLKRKLLLLRENPSRGKRIYGYSFLLFRLRLQDRGKALRVVYLVDGSTVKILCMLERKNNYADLHTYLEKLNLK